MKKIFTAFILCLMFSQNVSCSDKASASNEENSFLESPLPLFKGARPCQDSTFQAELLRGLPIVGSQNLLFNFGFDIALEDVDINSAQALSILIYKGQSHCKDGLHMMTYYKDSFRISPFYMKKIGEDQFSLHKKVKGIFSDSLGIFNKEEISCKTSSQNCWLNLKQQVPDSGEIEVTVKYINPVTELKETTSLKIFLEEASVDQILIGNFEN